MLQSAASLLSAITKEDLILMSILPLLFVLYFLYRHTSPAFSEKRYRHKICRQEWCSVKELQRLWITGPDSGLKYHDHPGCYIILIFQRAPRGHYLKYDDVYIGQSIHVYQRLMAHFSGKGNGDVYADIKQGRFVYATTVKCRQKGLNQMEKRLIAAFHATDSYNKTLGGSRVVRTSSSSSHKKRMPAQPRKKASRTAASKRSVRSASVSSVRKVSVVQK